MDRTECTYCGLSRSHQDRLAARVAELESLALRSGSPWWIAVLAWACGALAGITMARWLV